MAIKSVKKITVDELARMTQNGFTELKNSFRIELKGELAEHTRVILAEFRRLNDEVKDIKTILKPTTVMVAEHERRIGTLESRLEPVEKKVGIVRLRR